MHVLIVEEFVPRLEALSIALIKTGFMVSSAMSPKMARSYIQQGAVDVLVLPEMLYGRRVHSLALLAEHQNPRVATILMTNRSDPDTDELFDLLPSVHAMVARRSTPQLVAQLVRASVDYLVHADTDVKLPPSLRDDEFEADYDVELKPQTRFYRAVA